ncbi:MAG: type IV pilus modification PilV family protein [Candidatus Xenobia bacterium]
MVSRGFTLVEILVSLAILAAGVVFVVSIIPTAVLTLQRAEDLQAATAYGQELVEDARAHVPTAAGRDRDFQVTLNRTEFHVTRDIVVFPDLEDVVVTLQGPSDQQPVKLATRLFVLGIGKSSL